jgi:hypothetical protein
MKSEDELHALHALTVLTTFNARNFAALGSPTLIDKRRYDVLQCEPRCRAHKL